MFNLDSYYITFVSGIIIVIQALNMLGTHVPKTVQMRKYRTSRLLLVCAYLLLAIPGVLEFHLDKTHFTLEIQDSMILAIASFESMLFTVALITLLQPDFLTYRNFFKRLGLPVLITVCFIPAFVLDNPLLLEGAFYFAIFLYFLQLCFYTYLFRQKYKTCLAQIDDYYAEEEERRFRWIKQVFYLSLGIGVASLLFPFFSHLVYDMYVVVYTIIYVYLSIEFNNYATLYQQVYPAISIPEPVSQEAASPEADDAAATPMFSNTEIEQHLEQSLKEWVAKKKYTETRVSLDEIAISMGTNRSYLSRHLNASMNTNFKTWRTQLRIEEAQRLLIAHPELSIAEVGTMVGIHDRTNFHHRFQKVTGVTPTEWRKEHIEKRD